MYLLEGKVAVVTGASKGIGKEITKQFLDNGAFVFACSRNIDLLNIDNDRLFKYSVDVNDKLKLKSMFTDIFMKFKRLDILVNNAGIMKDARIGMISDSLVNQVFATNVFALFETIQLASRLMMKSKFGSIINMTSMIGDKGFSGQLVYSASKGAVLSMTKSAAKELAVHGIRVNAISPGVIKTDLIESLNENQLKDITDRVCLGRIGNPNDVANLALFLASDLSNYITGQVIGVDGATII